jgi:hypothetical protein
VRGSWWRLPSVFPSGGRSTVLGSRSSGVGDLTGAAGAIGARRLAFYAQVQVYFVVGRGVVLFS